MLCAMAIRMKEWGMLAPAAAGVDRSGQKQAILNHVDVAQSRAQSLQQLGSGLGTYLQGEGEREERRRLKEQEDLLNQVQSTGELSHLMNKLHEASQLSADEMQDINPDQDFEYAWKQRSTPHYKAALSSLSPASRQAGEQLANMMNQQAYIQTRQQHKLSRISQARHQWNESLQRSIDEGNENDAGNWVESVADIFIPRSDVKKAKTTAQSAARFRQWDDRFKNAPIQTLAEYKKAASNQLPHNEEHRNNLTTLYKETRLGAKSALVNELSRKILANQQMTASELQSSLDAGLISEQQVEKLTYQPSSLPTSRNALSYCQWQQRIDLCPSVEEDLLDTKLQIASAPLATAEKKQLLLRLESNATLPENTRSSMSHSIWNAYQSGKLGTPGDSMSLARLRALQERAPQLVARDELKKLDDLIGDYSLPDPVWVCHSDLRTPPTV